MEVWAKQLALLQEPYYSIVSLKVYPTWKQSERLGLAVRIQDICFDCFKRYISGFVHMSHWDSFARLSSSIRDWNNWDALETWQKYTLCNPVIVIASECSEKAIVATVKYHVDHVKIIAKGPVAVQPRSYRRFQMALKMTYASMHGAS